MSAGFCACGGNGNPNTGFVQKDGVTFKKMVAGYAMLTTNDDGDANVINATDFVNGELPASFVDNKIRESDFSKRWFPIIKLEQVTSVRGDRAQSSQQTGENQRNTARAVRPWTGMIDYGGAVLASNLNRFSCEQISIFKVDTCGSLSGEIIDGNEDVLYPWKIAYDSWYVDPIWAEGDEKYMTAISFEFDSTTSDFGERIISDKYIKVNLTRKEGLKNVTQEISNITNTTFTAFLALEFGSFGENNGVPLKCPQTGLVLADFVLYDVTADAPIAISSVTPTSIKGQYNFITAAMTATNTMELRQSDTAGVYDKPFEFVVSPFTAV